MAFKVSTSFKSSIVPLSLTTYIFSLVAWMITLTEIYREPHQVPVVFLTLIFISVLIISILAQSLGILLGYWRMNRNG